MKMIAIALTVIFAVLAIGYFIGVPPLEKHIKHGILFAILAILAVVWLRFQNTQPARH
jgi:ABC-type transport system involved in multi-copper enzyme maturation permease subunit